MKELIELAKEPKFADDKERKFCMVAIERVERGHATFWYPASIVYWVICLALAWFSDYPSLTKTILFTSSTAMIVAKGVVFLLVRDTNRLRAGQLVGFTLSNVIMAFAASTMHTAGLKFDALAIVWALGSVLALALLAFRNYVHIFALVIFLGLFTWQLWGHHPYGLGILFTASMAIITSNCQIILKRYVKSQMIKSYRQQSVYTPKQVLLQAIEKEISVGDLFRPELRYCVCICADWRSFQSFSSNVTPTQLATTLEHYYDLQIKLLDQSFPEGNYFIDWIADELFVVGYLTEKCGEQQLIANAVSYGKASISARAGFFQQHGAPRGLDVGVSAGMTTVGMLGPEGNKKATALGQVPGVARRLQTLAKELRKIDGDCDRLVADVAVRDHTDAETLGLTGISIPDGVDVKDLTCSSVLLYEHEKILYREVLNPQKLRA